MQISPFCRNICTKHKYREYKDHYGEMCKQFCLSKLSIMSHLNQAVKNECIKPR